MKPQLVSRTTCFNTRCWLRQRARGWERSFLPLCGRCSLLRHRNSRAAALSVNHEDLLTAAASLTADKECPTMQYLTSWINCS